MHRFWSDRFWRNINQMYDTNLDRTLLQLAAYCRASDWAGYDPYDALTSKWMKRLPLLNSSVPRIAMTQALKRSPINLRGVLAIPKTQNPKALALFLSSLVLLDAELYPGRGEEIRRLIELIKEKRSSDTTYWNWGYSFPWQTRKEVVPAGWPNLVCTTFVASGLMDAYESLGDSDCLAMAVSAAEYIVDKLYWSDAKGIESFSYPQPLVPSQTHNANFLASGLLCRIYKHTKQQRLLAPALGVARCSVQKQRPDGSWYYGESPSQAWIDNFHSGYNLRALRSIGAQLGTTEFEPSVKRGFEFYRAHFFRDNGAVKYFHDRNYPIDTHCIAESMLTLVDLADLSEENVGLASGVFQWAMTHMWDERGFFYYRKLRLGTVRTSYMRWSQAWMMLAMASLRAKTRKSTERFAPETVFVAGT